MNSAMYSIFFHNYYGQHRKWIEFFSKKMTIPFNLFYNIVEDSFYNGGEDDAILVEPKDGVTGSYLNKLTVRKSPNLGKDIGGKLVLLDTYLHLKEETEFIIFMHDKKSPHKIQNKEWQQKLFQIVEPDFIAQALSFFKANPKTGIIAMQESIQNEYDYSQQSFRGTNQLQLTQLRSEYGIKNTDYRHVAGTMFWVRSLPLISFFTKHSPLNIRKTLESGNVMDENTGTITHAWERMLSWIITEQGYTIKGF
ncbi:MAG TPA: rhamnan synthesis F family protein [Chitinophagaceae bacterium]|nr:rhamnan synthesis F family protein [Chitinophagaceae bacterium]